MLLTKIFTFEAAHKLTKYHGKCERMHGHSYKLEVTIEGESQENGMILDFGVLKKIVKEQVLNKLDHYTLNDIIENPTCENMAQWIWTQLEDLPSLLVAEKEDPNLSEDIKRLFDAADLSEMVKEVNEKVHLFEIKLWETDTSYVTFRG